MIDWDGTVKIIDFGLAWTGGDNEKEEKVWYEMKEDMICDVGTGYVCSSISVLMYRRWRAPELLFSPTTYDPFALDLWGIGVVITDMFRPTPLQNADSDSEDGDQDPLEEEVIRSPTQTTLFDDGFGDIGLAGSIFRVLGNPTAETWPVSSGCR
jgi:serine/threonine protein kinase